MFGNVNLFPHLTSSHPENWIFLLIKIFLPLNISCALFRLSDCGRARVKFVGTKFFGWIKTLWDLRKWFQPCIFRLVIRRAKGMNCAQNRKKACEPPEIRSPLNIDMWSVKCEVALFRSSWFLSTQPACVASKGKGRSHFKHPQIKFPLIRMAAWVWSICGTLKKSHLR